MEVSVISDSMCFLLQSSTNLHTIFFKKEPLKVINNIFRPIFKIGCIYININHMPSLTPA